MNTAFKAIPPTLDERQRPIDVLSTGAVVRCYMSNLVGMYVVEVEGQHGFKCTFRSYTAVPVGTRWTVALWREERMT